MVSKARFSILPPPTSSPVCRLPLCFTDSRLAFIVHPRSCRPTTPSSALPVVGPTLLLPPVVLELQIQPPCLPAPPGCYSCVHPSTPCLPTPLSPSITHDCRYTSFHCLDPAIANPCPPRAIAESISLCVSAIHMLPYLVGRSHPVLHIEKGLYTLHIYIYIYSAEYIYGEYIILTVT
jgi:hypothetical protein